MNNEKQQDFKFKNTQSIKVRQFCKIHNLSYSSLYIEEFQIIIGQINQYQIVLDTSFLISKQEAENNSFQRKLKNSISEAIGMMVSHRNEYIYSNKGFKIQKQIDDKNGNIVSVTIPVIPINITGENK